MNINTLPDLCLRRIFYWLPLLDQITLNKVCPRWEALQSSVTCSRKAVTLIVNRTAPDPELEPFTNRHDSYIPFLDQIVPNSKPYSEKLYYSNLSQELIDDLMNVLPNIISLTIRIKLTGADEMDLIVQLLEQWKTLLTVFEFDSTFETQYQTRKSDIERCANQIFPLFNFINRELLNLDCLTLNLYDQVFEELDDPWRIEGQNLFVLDLPCLGWLREFRFASHDPVTILFDSLKSYAAKNERLESIYLGIVYPQKNFLTLFRNLPELARKFKALSWRIGSLELPIFLETFTSLETLDTEFGEDLHKFTPLLSPLKNLIHFHAYIHDSYDQLRQFDSIPSYKLHQLPTVKILTIEVGPSRKFNELQSKHWGWIFPSVQLVHVKIMGLEAIKPEHERCLKERINCIKQLLKPLKQLPEMKRLISLDISEESKQKCKEWTIEEL